MTLVAISPHLDDVVLSIAQTLAAVPDQHPEWKLIVTTVFAGLPGPDVLSGYDAQFGYESSNEAMKERRREDRAALELLRAEPRHLGFLDHQYRNTPDSTMLAVRDAIRSLFDSEWHTLVPLGIGHPDHSLVRQAALKAAHKEILFYEELPYRVLWPEQVFAAFEVIRNAGWRIDPVVIPWAHGDRFVKESAIACYKSQFPDGATDPCLLVPERIWRAHR